MISEVLVDALPYIDLGYDDPGVREAVSIIRYNWKRVFIFCLLKLLLLFLRLLEWLKKNAADINLQKIT